MAFLIVKRKKLKETGGELVIIISKKVSKKATVRNRLKRQIRSVIRQQVKEKGTNGSITVIVGPEILKKSFKEIEYEISRFMPN